MDAIVSEQLARVVLPVDKLEHLWTFEPSTASLLWKLRRSWRFARRLTTRPAHHVLKPVFQAPRWNVYFIFSLQGELSPSHHYSLKSLRSSGVPLLVIVATRNLETIPPDLALLSDALIWKNLSGYDFSAYRIGLEQIARTVPHADILIMNDSVFGPFGDIEKLVAAAPWRVTGFTSSAVIENHIQSYAYILKSFDAVLLDNCSTVMLPNHAFDRAGDVILCQECQFARIAAHHVSVGSFWHGAADRDLDPMLNLPLELIDAGMPFMKKSLFGKMKSFQNSEIMQRKLIELGHPPHSLI
ncbi:hypothetical protein [Aliihoeflea sp. 2WW]|uniref:hypothetical protein n=1 Tax=Aliihoeflea sp. 2WW TaxID=1381123 RepID=UPI001267D573|nr:hypothetical protein [Aliihoeflea sp. 2WW]